MRWSLLPTVQPVKIDPVSLDAGGADALEQEITRRVTAAPLRWTMQVTVAGPTDPIADPSKPWLTERQTVDVGTLVVNAVQPERDGPCRDINYDPTVLPDGIATSSDPFPAARSAAYAVSYDRRTAEAANYPRTTSTQPEGARP